MTPEVFARRASRIREAIDAAAASAGREGAEVQLLAVSKFHPAESIRAAMIAGHRCFGENYAAELLDKEATLRTWNLEPQFHFIGGLQSKKVRKLIGHMELCHSVDRPSLLNELQRRAGEADLVQKILIQVNIADENSKSGCTPEEALGLALAASSMENLLPSGLMVIPPPAAEPEDSRPWFRALRQLRDSIRERLPNPEAFFHLSMGMTDDYQVAVEEGSTIVRIGTALFGSRIS